MYFCCFLGTAGPSIEPSTIVPSTIVPSTIVPSTSVPSTSVPPPTGPAQAIRGCKVKHNCIKRYYI